MVLNHRVQLNEQNPLESWGNLSFSKKDFAPRSCLVG